MSDAPPSIPRTTTSTFMPTKSWQKSSTIYQIYPISFFDSNDDGIGDLPGITSKLDYLKEVGVDVLWLSPIYRSPGADGGYDISDYCNIDPRYGTLEDWDELLKGVHERGMKLIMDLVVNHTSNEHEWFIQSRSSKSPSNPKRDWYIWRPPRYVVDSETGETVRKEPNNWRSVFQGSAWEYDESTDEYYLHLYVSKQPDLNWEKPEVRQAAYDVMKFWVDRGCDGFRMDVINIISKTPGLPDAPIIDPQEEFQPASIYFANGPRVHEFLREMYESVLSKHDLITVGETPFTHSSSELAAYVLPQNKELNMVFQFELMDIDHRFEGEEAVPLLNREWKLEEFREIVSRWQGFMREEGFWNTIFIENHDHPRAVSRFGNTSTPFLRSVSAKMLCILQITQSGTLFLYQGQELGMQNFPRSWGLEEYKDVATGNYWKRVWEARKAEAEKEGQGGEPEMNDVLDNFSKKARDHARVPMQWDGTPNAGFTKGKPWMRVNEDYQTWNAAVQMKDKNSVLNFYKRALRVRKDYDTLIYGDFMDISKGHPSVFAYTRSSRDERFLVILNFKEEEVDFKMEQSDTDVEFGHGKLKLVLGNYDGEEPFVDPNLESENGFRLRAYEGRVYLYENAHE